MDSREPFIRQKKLDEFLTAHGMKLDKVIDIEVEKEELITRLTGRRVCKKCGASDHVVNIPPKKKGICDICGGELFQRADDTVETVENRIEVYNEQTMPLVDYYKEQTISLPLTVHFHLRQCLQR